MPAIMSRTVLTVLALALRQARRPQTQRPTRAR